MKFSYICETIFFTLYINKDDILSKDMKITKITIFILLLPFLFVMPSSCEKWEPERAESTILVYMAARNNLARFAVNDVNEMAEGYLPDYFGKGEKGNVLMVYLDIPGEAPTLYRIYRDEYGSPNKEILKEYDSGVSSVDPEQMREVISYSENLFPSEVRGLVLWSHGTGWLPEGFYSNPSSVDRNGVVVQMESHEDPYRDYVKSFGSEGGREMDIKDLADAIPGHYSFILFDACLMGGIEVAYQLKDKCDYFIGSAAEILAGGFPYDKVMSPLFVGGERGYRKCCEEFFSYYDNNGDGATVALVRSDRLPALATAARSVFDASRSFITSVDPQTLQGYYRNGKHWFYDLEHFISELVSPKSDRYEAFSKALDEAVIEKLATPEFTIASQVQFEIKRFSGLSTYVPNPENSILDSYYRELAWNKAVLMIE